MLTDEFCIQVDFLWKNKEIKKVTAIEMESYAVMAAASSYNIYCAVIKSVCDLGDKNKSDNIQNYCAYASASVAIKFIAEKMHSLS
ncbi:phosphorylase family protein [Serratia fonticola]